jgi:DNA-binding ferritin-like protein (Dps family)
MSLISDKKNILNQVGVLNSLGQKIELPKDTNTFGSINNKKEPLAFLLDLLGQLQGSTAIAASMGQLLTSFVDKIEPQLKTSLKQQLIPFNSNEQLPLQFLSNGYDIPMKSIDGSGKLKTNPNSDIGSLIYGDNTNNFDRTAYNAITTAGSDIAFNNTSIRYNNGFDSMTVKPTNGAQTVGAFVNNYVDGITLINKKEFNTSILNEVFGVSSKAQNKSLEEIIEDEKTDGFIDKLIAEEELEFTEKEISNIEINATNKLNGINALDLGCGFFETNVSVARVNELVSKVSGTTNPDLVVNQYNEILIDSTNGQVLGKDENTAKDNFFRRLIKAIQKFIVKSITISPQIQLLKYIVSGLKNGNILLPTDIQTDLKNSKSLADCLSKDVKSTINKFYFDLIKALLIKLVINAGKLIIREKLQGYSNILKSLV